MANKMNKGAPPVHRFIRGSIKTKTNSKINKKATNAKFLIIFSEMVYLTTVKTSRNYFKHVELVLN